MRDNGEVREFVGDTQMHGSPLLKRPEKPLVLICRVWHNRVNFL
jgi:hypothetical protein